MNSNKRKINKDRHSGLIARVNEGRMRDLTLCPTINKPILLTDLHTFSSSIS